MFKKCFVETLVARLLQNSLRSVMFCFFICVGTGLGNAKTPARLFDDVGVVEERYFGWAKMLIFSLILGIKFQFKNGGSKMA